LRACLENNAHLFDELFVYDDRSDDDSVSVASDFTDNVFVRPSSIPSFLEHEGKFRFSSWNEFEYQMDPKIGDWIFSFDADEFIVSKRGDVRESLEGAVLAASRRAAVGVMIPFPEIFDVDDDGVPLTRVDGYWGRIRGPRFFTYKPDALWSDKPMGCGSEPVYVSRGPLSSDSCGIHALHFGYARNVDKKIKYDRYTSLYQHGHDDKHIQSILKDPTLVRWDGPVPKYL
jgi:hypothetical protein